LKALPAVVIWLYILFQLHRTGTKKQPALDPGLPA